MYLSRLTPEEDNNRGTLPGLRRGAWTKSSGTRGGRPELFLLGEMWWDQFCQARFQMETRSLWEVAAERQSLTISIVKLPVTPVMSIEKL